MGYLLQIPAAPSVVVEFTSSHQEFHLSETTGRAPCKASSACAEGEMGAQRVLETGDWRVERWSAWTLAGVDCCCW